MTASTSAPSADVESPRRRAGAWRSGFDATMGRVQARLHKDMPIGPVHGSPPNRGCR